MSGNCSRTRRTSRWPGQRSCCQWPLPGFLGQHRDLERLWELGTSAPFDNDTAADFCGDLDEAAAGEREGIVRGALTHVIDTVDHLEAPESEVAVAAAALVAAQCPGGEPADPVYGPDELLPDLTGLRDLARQALDRVMTEPSELMELWAESDGGTWCTNVRQLQNVLLPQPPGEQLSLI